MQWLLEQYPDAVATLTPRGDTALHVLCSSKPLVEVRLIVDKPLNHSPFRPPICRIYICFHCSSLNSAECVQLFCHFKIEFSKNINYGSVRISEKVAIVLRNVDGIMSEFRECLQKMDNNMEICRIRCQYLRNFLKLLFPKPNKLVFGG